jgi:hypothetical protein
MEFLVRCAFAVPGWLTFGVGLSLMWGWFLTPLGAPPIGWAHAMGLGAIFAFIALSERDAERPGRPLDKTVGILAAVLFVRWVIVAAALAFATMMPAA